ncbi:phosphoglycerate mutase-like protein [Scenedesmus sp. PABB004]|nr:phosphoglycerate mutase-like protein [Scenedesmus sp. PABB004]
MRSARRSSAATRAAAALCGQRRRRAARLAAARRGSRGARPAAQRRKRSGRAPSPAGAGGRGERGRAALRRSVAELAATVRAQQDGLQQQAAALARLQAAVEHLQGAAVAPAAGPGGDMRSSGLFDARFHSASRRAAARRAAGRATPAAPARAAPGRPARWTASAELRRAPPPAASLAAARRARDTRVLPQRIILVRHAQSEGNVNAGAYTYIPDPQVPLTALGRQQAYEAGLAIRRHMEEAAGGSDAFKLFFFASPYARSLQTCDNIRAAFDCSQVAGVQEEVQLREQDFGNFQDAEGKQREKLERVRYGRFFYRFPNGESGADVYDRITVFSDHLIRDINAGARPPCVTRAPSPHRGAAEAGAGRSAAAAADACARRAGRFANNTSLVLVTHGLALRIFLMRWFHWGVDQFMSVYNPPNAVPIVLEKVDAAALEGTPAALHTKSFYRLSHESMAVLKGLTPDMCGNASLLPGACGSHDEVFAGESAAEQWAELGGGWV